MLLGCNLVAIDLVPVSPIELKKLPACNSSHTLVTAKPGDGSQTICELGTSLAYEDTVRFQSLARPQTSFLRSHEASSVTSDALWEPCGVGTEHP